MYALPPDLTPPSGDQVSGIACPICHGVSNVRSEGAGHLTFTCRVGHAFSVREIVTSLEQHFEDLVWASIRAAEEMDALLGDIVAFRHRVADAPPDASYGERRTRAREQAAWLRQVLDRNEPIRFRELPVEESGGGAA